MSTTPPRTDAHGGPAGPRRAAAAAFVAAALALPACSENPATGKRQLALISEAQELELGRETAAEVESSLGLVPDERLQSYVHGIGARLAAGSERPALPWRFRVVDDPTPNAFALPGGYVYVTRGLLALLNSEAELASVLGHEIAHVTARHSVQMLSRAQIAEAGLNLGVRLFPNLEGVAGFAASGLQLLFLKHGRDAERQADRLGFQYTLEQGYDVREMRDVFEQLQLAGTAERGGTSPLPGWLQTHPSEPERIREVERRLAEVAPRKDARVAREDYLAAIDGLVLGEDPRHGWFRGTTFLHPELAFRFDVPTGWRTENLTSAVIATSEAGDAQLQLRLAPDAPPEALARSFLAGRNVRGRVEPVRVNGLPAAVGRFEVDTPRGALAGVVAFLRHGDTSFQLVGLGPAAAIGAHLGALERSIASFAPLTEPAAFAVRPARLRIVRLPRAQSLADYARARGGRVAVARLALINGIRDSRKVLPAGTAIKDVIDGPR